MNKVNDVWAREEPAVASREFGDLDQGYRGGGSLQVWRDPGGREEVRKESMGKFPALWKITAGASLGD